MRCSDVEHLLPQYTDGALPASQAESIASHLADCADCRRELALLQRSLEALNRVAREPAPDLWEQFQARLAQNSAAALCREMETLLPSYAEGDLERAERARVRQHLAECEACARLEAEHSRPFRALEQLAAEPATVDLWPSFTARLAATLSCAEVEAELPALLAGETVRNSLAHQAHLASCRSCAAAVAAYDRSLTALSRTAQGVPEVDLWPAFSERLGTRAPSGGARRGPASWLPALGSWMRGPLLQPVVGFAVFALLTLAGNLVSHALSTQLRRAELTAETPLRPRPVAVGEKHRAAPLLAVHRAAPRPELPRMVRAERAVRPLPQSDRDHEPRIRSAVQSVSNVKSSPKPATPPEVRVAFNLPATGMREVATTDPILSTEPVPGTPAADRDGMQAVVQAVELLAGSEDALHSPFDSKTNE